MLIGSVVLVKLLHIKNRQYSMDRTLTTAYSVMIEHKCLKQNEANLALPFK